ncbi:hypothetical protein HMPREF9278_1799 [Mobiluncus mulieris FB024-16]|nr:hypothetical protein HMPREF9278_1799 [Mobiluncus mulieris FB024-16]
MYPIIFSVILSIVINQFSAWGGSLLKLTSKAGQTTPESTTENCPAWTLV